MPVRVRVRVRVVEFSYNVARSFVVSYRGVICRRRRRRRRRQRRPQPPRRTRHWASHTDDTRRSDRQSDARPQLSISIRRRIAYSRTRTSRRPTDPSARGWTHVVVQPAASRYAACKRSRCCMPITPTHPIIPVVFVKYSSRSRDTKRPPAAFSINPHRRTQQC